MKEKIIQTKTCKHCSSSFDITDKDLEFYDKVSPKFNGVEYSVPTPTFCPDCRQQRRLCFINELNLYKGKCDLCKNDIVSRFNPESGIKVYCNECWSGDKWNSLDYGLDIDFNKSIFEQIDNLVRKTPFQNLVGSLSNIENNSVYTNYTAEIVDSYMVCESDFIQSCIYGRGLRKSNNLIDCLNCSNSEYCYECVDSDLLYNCNFSLNSIGSNYCFYISDCHGCDNCIFSFGLKNMKYFVLNKQLTKQEYEEFKDKLEDTNFKEKMILDYHRLLKKEFKSKINILNFEDCSGDYILNSKNCINCYDILECQDCKYCNDINNSHDLMDISSYGSNSDHMYEGVSVGRYSRNIFFSCTVGKGEDFFYCIDTKKSKNCFACVNLKDKEYCILNKQYTKEEYNELVPKIIEKMKKDLEWGEFFPSSMSPFGYNETVAQEYFPLEKEEAKNKGFNWSDYEPPKPNVEKVIPADKLPEKIEDIPDDILNWAIKCEITDKPYRIIKPELEFYRKHNLPIPKRHPDQRHLDRMKLRNPRKLWDRKCDKCGEEIKTTYSPDREEVVYCEKCYEKEVY